MPEGNKKGSEVKKKGETGKSNANVTRLKRERRDTDHSDSEFNVPKPQAAHSVRSGSTHPHKKGILLENTYKLSPDEDTHFSAPKVRNIAKAVLEQVLEGKEYSKETTPNLTKEIVTKVKEETKKLKMPRHKIVVHAVVSQKAEQSMKVASRCLWNHSFDSHTSAEYESKNLVGLVTVYGIYFE